MGTTHYALGGAMHGAPVPVKEPRVAAYLTTSATSNSGALPAQAGEYLTFTSYNANCLVRLGPPGVAAAAANSYPVPSGGSFSIGPAKDGDVVSVIDATVV